MTTTITDFPNLWKSERLGDPCPCGCGGVKALPPETKSRTLGVALPCRVCGEVRIFPPGKQGHHPSTCLHCTRKASVRFGKGSGYKPAEDFYSLLGSALDRNGMTLGQACATAGLSRTTVQHWVNGSTTPWRHSLEQLADVLDAPKLVDALPSKTGRITVSCPDCGEIRSHRATEIRVWLRKNIPPNTAIDWETGTGTYRCLKCARSAQIKSVYSKRIKRHGKKFYVEQGRRLAANLTPEQRTKGLQAAQAARWDHPQSATAQWNMSISRIVPKPQGQFGVCTICNRLIHIVGKDKWAKFHQTCLITWRRKNQKGLATYPPHPKGHTYSSEYLATSFELCVRHLLRDEPIGKSDGAGLAGQLGLSRRSVIERIKIFVELFPPDGIGRRRLAFWREAFLEAAREKYSYNV